MNVCRSLPYVSSVLGAIAGRYYISQRDNHRNLFAGVLLLSPAAIANEVADDSPHAFSANALVATEYRYRGFSQSNKVSAITMSGMTSDRNLGHGHYK